MLLRYTYKGWKFSLLILSVRYENFRMILDNRVEKRARVAGISRRKIESTNASGVRTLCVYIISYIIRYIIT